MGVGVVFWPWMEAKRSRDLLPNMVVEMMKGKNDDTHSRELVR